MASRVSPAGNWSTAPRLIHDSYARVRFRLAGDRRYLAIGTARTTPATRLNSAPILTRSPRLEVSPGEVIESLPRWAVDPDRAGPELPSAARLATPPRPRRPRPTSRARVRCSASRARPARDAPRRRLFADPDRSPAPGMTRRRWS